MRPHARFIATALAALVLALGAAGCGDDDEPEATGSGDTTEDTTADTSGGDAGDRPDNAIVAKGFAFEDLTVGPGEELVLKNEDDAPHTATADDGAFDLNASGGETSDPATAPDEPGTYTFHCNIHGGMTGTLTVEG